VEPPGARRDGDTCLVGLVRRGRRQRRERRECRKGPTPFAGSPPALRAVCGASAGTGGGAGGHDSLEHLLQISQDSIESDASPGQVWAAGRWARRRGARHGGRGPARHPREIMRRNILHAGAANLKYEIREIVGAAYDIEGLGQEITWENIGDPVQKGEAPPPWIRRSSRAARRPESWAYCDTRGVPRRARVPRRRGQRARRRQVTPDDIIFFNGLGDAVAKVYGFSCGARRASSDPRRRTARIPRPRRRTPATTTSRTSSIRTTAGCRTSRTSATRSSTTTRSRASCCCRPTTPRARSTRGRSWRRSPRSRGENDIASSSRTRSTNIVYDGGAAAHERVDRRRAGDRHARHQQGVPVAGFALRLARGAEQGTRRELRALRDSLLAAKRLEVSSTTLPQMSIPRVMGDPRYPEHLRRRELMFAAAPTRWPRRSPAATASSSTSRAARSTSR
jgi:alanine-synthesizing transaminase